MSASKATDSAFLTPQNAIDHWQGQRRLTRRLIEIFPEDQLFTFSLGGMRTFGALATELLQMAAPTVQGVATLNWTDFQPVEVKSRADILAAWDASTETMNKHWPTIPVERFHETMNAFGQYEDRVNNLIMYVIDNEVHHRGQGYVYLRALGIEPPAFWERG
jgi:uncharacterized damage-inducible protein DinB